MEPTLATITGSSLYAGTTTVTVGCSGGGIDGPRTTRALRARATADVSESENVSSVRVARL